MQFTETLGKKIFGLYVSWYFRLNFLLSAGFLGKKRPQTGTDHERIGATNDRSGSLAGSLLPN